MGAKMTVLAVAAIAAAAAHAVPATAQVGWGDPFQVSEPADGSRTVIWPALAYNAADGETLVAYHSDAPTDGVMSIRVRRLGPTGAPVAPEAGIETVSGAQQSATGPAIAADPEHDRWLVAFAGDTDTGPSLDNRLFAQLLDGTGNQIGPDDQQLSYTPNAGNLPTKIAYSASADRYLVVWQGPGNVFGQLLDADGAKVGPILKISDAGGVFPDVAFEPAVAANAAGEFLVVFARTTTHPHHGVYGQRISAAGAMLPDATDVAIALPAEADHSATFPALAFDPVAGRYVVAFLRYEDSGAPVVAQMLAADGTPAGGEIAVSESSAGTVAPGLAASGSSLVTWAADGYGQMYSQLIAPDGTPQGADEPIAPFMSTRAPAVARMGSAWITAYAAPTTSGGFGGFARVSGAPVAPPPAPPPASPAPPAAPQPPPKLPAFGSIVTLSSAKRCGSRRILSVRLRLPSGVTIRSAEIRVNGKRVRFVQGRGLTAPIVVRKMPKGRTTVKIKLSAADGRTISGTKRYRACKRR